MVVLVVVLAVLAGLFVASLFVRRFRESSRPGLGWQATGEVFVDPSTGRRMRVWVDPTDRSRHYVPEGGQPGHV